MASSKIAEFYNGKNIFLTGGTGFVGKVLIEKLLRTCPGVEGIYCLVRPKNGHTANERLKNMLKETLFESVLSENPDFTEKCHAIHGDVMEEELGISQSDRAFLEENISIVFHSAATVKFEEPLRTAIEMNVLAVRRMIHLCSKMKHLEVFVHVSTAYSNCERDMIDEVVYPPPVEPQKLIDAMSWMSDDMMEVISPKLLGSKPNTYTFTKHLAESLLLAEGAGLPLAVVRPSIITATWKEPIPGWIDNLNGPSGLYIAMGKGLLRSMVGDHNGLADIIPVDLVANAMLAVAWYTASMKPSNTLVYHITSGGQIPFKWGDMQNMVCQYFKRYPLETAFRRPRGYIFTPHSFFHDCWVLVSHLVPAYTMDLAFVLIGKKPRMVRTYNKLHKALSTLEYFTSNEWQWTTSNMELLRASMTDEDLRLFYFDLRGLHWPTYMENYCLGAKKYILKEDMSELPAARAHLRKLRNIRYAFNTILLVVAWRVLIARSQLARNSWYFVLGMVFKFVRFFRITSTITTS